MDSIDKFGRHLSKSNRNKQYDRLSQPISISGGNYNLNNKRLRNVMDPEENFDVANKQYVDHYFLKAKETSGGLYEKLDTLEKALSDLYEKIKVLNELVHTMLHRCDKLEQQVYTHS